MVEKLNRHLVALLEVIVNSRSVEALLADGFDYGHIAALVFDADSEGLIRLGRTGEEVTQKGLDYLRANQAVGHSVEQARRPLPGMQFEAWPSDRVYLPPFEFSFFD